METRRQANPSIVGNVPVESVAMNAKGGSLSAIFKQSLRGQFQGGKACFGARMDFEPGVSCVLVAPAQTATKGRRGESPKFRIQRLTNHRYIIDLETDDQEIIDPMTMATLKLLEEMAKTGKLTPLRGQAADKRFGELQKKMKQTDKLVEGLKKRSASSYE